MWGHSCISGVQCTAGQSEEGGGGETVRQGGFRRGPADQKCTHILHVDNYYQASVINWCCCAGTLHTQSVVVKNKN